MLNLNLMSPVKPGNGDDRGGSNGGDTGTGGTDKQKNWALKFNNDNSRIDIPPLEFKAQTTLEFRVQLTAPGGIFGTKGGQSFFIRIGGFDGKNSDTLEIQYGGTKKTIKLSKSLVGETASIKLEALSQSNNTVITCYLDGEKQGQITENNTFVFNVLGTKNGSNNFIGGHLYDIKVTAMDASKSREYPSIIKASEQPHSQVLKDISDNGQDGTLVNFGDSPWVEIK